MLTLGHPLECLDITLPTYCIYHTSFFSYHITLFISQFSYHISHTTYHPLILMLCLTLLYCTVYHIHYFFFFFFIYITSSSLIHAYSSFHHTRNTHTTLDDNRIIAKKKKRKKNFFFISSTIFFFFLSTHLKRHATKRDSEYEKIQKKRKTYSTWYSHMVPHCSTNQARCSLTSEIGRDPVFPALYGRKLKTIEQYTILSPYFV